MATIDVPARNIPANTLTVSPGASVAANFRAATIQLIDSSAQWFTRTGFVTIWGLQVSTDNGQTWDWGPVMQQEPAPGLPFGSRDRSGGMPALRIESSDFVGLSGAQVRLAMLTAAGSQTVRLGATVTTT